MDAYSMSYQVRWTDIDANLRVCYSAYIDAATELRLGEILIITYKLNRLKNRFF
jgi:hypothetical protein